MSNILRAQQDPPFGWFYRWTKLNEFGVAEDDIETALKQPETIRIKWDRGRARAGAPASRSEISAEVVPDKAMLGPEYALIYTIPDFESKIKGRMEETEEDYGKRLFELFGRCLQHKAKTKWDEVVRNFPENERSAETLKEAIRQYLEKVANIRKLGDVLIRQLRLRSKPAAMKFDDYLARREEWMRHIDSGYLNKELAMPTQQELVEQVFEQQPKSHQRKYAAEHEEVETDLHQLRVFFNGCHAADRSDGTFAKVLKSTKEQKKLRDARDNGEDLGRKPMARTNASRSRASSSGYRDSYRQPRYEGRSNRYHDRRTERSSRYSDYQRGRGRSRSRYDRRSGGHDRDRSRSHRDGERRESDRRDAKRSGKNGHAHHVSKD